MNVVFTHGKTLENQIDTIISRWEKEVEKNFDADFNAVITSFFENSTMVDTIKKYCPELLEEVKGIAEGSNQPYEIILALQMSEEIESAGDYLFQAKCTAIGSGKNSRSAGISCTEYGSAIFFCMVSQHCYT